MNPTSVEAPRLLSLRAILFGLALNLPFLLSHPAAPLIGAPILRSLVTNLILFLVPGLPFVGVMIGRRLLDRWRLLWIILASTTVFVTVLAGSHLLGLQISANLMWNGTWIVTDLGLLLLVIHGAVPTPGFDLRDRRWIGALLLFLAAYVALYVGATRIVPVLGDQDDEVQGTAYGLMTHLKPSLLTGRNTEFMFAHPPLLHFYVAGSLTYYGLLDDLAYYDSLAPQRHSLQEISQHYYEHPYRLETRAPNIFLAALTIVILAGWCARLSGRWWFGVLAVLVYGSCTEVFVRSSYGGYFALAVFSQLLVLEATERWRLDSGRRAWTFCFLAGLFAAISDHKTLPLIFSIVVWQYLRSRTDEGLPAISSRVGVAMRHPAAVGFLSGWALFWIYGLSISPRDFWMDHVRHHLVDRALRFNARHMDLGRYPSVAALWSEFWRDTGYVILPLGVVALAWICLRRAPAGEPGRRTAGWRNAPGLWATWALLTAIVFSYIDWRQTKHLAPLALPLMLGICEFSSRSRIRALVACLLVGALIWNVGALRDLAANFEALAKVPEW